MSIVLGQRHAGPTGPRPAIGSRQSIRDGETGVDRDRHMRRVGFVVRFLEIHGYTVTQTGARGYKLGMLESHGAGAGEGGHAGVGRDGFC
jgi:hypothetical protein